MDPIALRLLPLPRSVRSFGEAWAPPARLVIALEGVRAARAPEAADPRACWPVLGRLARALERHGARATFEPRRDGARPDVLARVEPDAGLGPEGYRLDLLPSGARVVGGTEAGVRHGLETLAQLARLAERGAVPALRVEDEPTFAERGAMLDVSRDRVPTNETLDALVARFASLKLNRLQLYTEHTFAYRGFEDVWAGADPVTHDELRRLDARCAAEGIELVPNQQSFGHMHRWLVHERLRPLAECPDGVAHPFSRAKEPFSLCPTDPRSLELVTGLFDELLDCVASRTLNAGCDETFDLGTGRSRAICEARGTGRVYLEYVSALARRLAERGVRMQFWADVLLSHPELARELPENVVPMLWGYEADHPFAEQADVLAASGRPFCVCPGTSAWQSFAGRFTNMARNVATAVREGRRAGARGVLVTDWGDRGHLQPLVASWPGWVSSADLAWNADAPEARRTPAGAAALLSDHVLEDASGAAGEAAIGLARLAETTGARLPNASPLSAILTRWDEPLPPPELEGLTAEGLAGAEARAAEALESLRGHRMACDDATTVAGELAFAGALATLASRLGRARLAAGGDAPVAGLPDEVRRALADELEPLRAEHRRLWRLRSRPGGLADSERWLSRPLAALMQGCPPGE